MRKFNLEMVVGLFMVSGFLCFVWLAVQLGDVHPFGRPSYRIKASFGSVSGLKPGAIVEIAGVKIGEVTDIRLETKYYEAEVELAINRGVVLQEDSIASVRTAGIIGDRYIDISPGGSEKLLQEGDSIDDTESAINLETLISKYIFDLK
ncbi:MAG: outer membrane lipid asymmetry maintenance protein MlaD [Desulfuromusa sp.]|nr:outer membrane lipid asymmetry maintenance protein MlaD [Desulfuromusa sp.]